jgi:RNA recognition motif-containing protein
VTIYVGNLSLEVTEGELRQYFSAFGEVASVIIANDKYIGSGQSKGYGFVEMLSQPEAQAAIKALNGQTLKQKTIDVIQALPLSKNGGDLLDTHNRKGRNSRNIRERKPYY